MDGIVCGAAANGTIHKIGCLSLAESRERLQIRQSWVAVLLGVALLLAAGAGYRVLSGQQQRVAAQQAVVSPVLSNMPLEFGSWRGRPAPLDRSVAAAIKADAYLSRRYEDLSTGEQVLLFVTAAANARAMLGHRPEICYPAIGWILENTQLVDIGAGTSPLHVRLQTFLSPKDGGRSQLVLSFFIVVGQLTIDEADFRDLYWRRPSLESETSSSLLQVQVIAPVTSDSASAAHLTIRFAASSIPLLSSLVRN